MAGIPTIGGALFFLCSLIGLVLSIRVEIIGTDGSLLSREGERIQIGKCISSEQNVTPTVKWYKNKVLLTSNKEDVMISEVVKKNQDTKLFRVESVLQYRPSRSDGGSQFHCEESYSTGYSLETQQSDDVHLHLVVPLERVKIEASPESTEVQEGDSISLTCTADCSPEAQFQWYKDDNELGHIGKVLHLKDISMEDAGVYTCTATDEDFNSHSDNITIKVFNRPVEEFVVRDGPNEEHFAEVEDPQKSISSQTGFITVLGILGMMVLIAFILVLMFYYSKNKQKKKALEKSEKEGELKRVEISSAD
ncbi:advanced glycosylation end product-specific receptor [Protopterus annectens]|uniref:advanced glycosylation end product-specific receptor n=1 Tax=Protopterus annectens TaxID=7888 RepID=UPI001CF996F2|nr:advanced glycosylation end product-specific receptor [Protopterus annectens]